MGSAQSARRIQPGGFGRPARDDGSPSPPPLRGRGCRAGTAARPAPAPVGRISTEAVRRDRLRVGWEGLGGQVARCRGAASVTAPGPHLSPPPGAEGDDRRRAFPPRPPAHHRPPSPRGGAGCGVAVRGPSCRGRAPLLPARLSTGADCPQCAPTASRRRAGRSHARAPGVCGDVGHPPDPS